jgi:hypothetical protein
VAEPTSDPPGARGKSPNLPPPPAAPDDLPESVAVPRMEPPPSSLGAMVQSRPGAPLGLPQRDANPWLVLAFLLIAGVAATVYLYR